jgi:hypothetical protein
LEYEYEARKKLYHEVEPILFQLFDLSRNAYGRILSLAAQARRGNLEPNHGFLSSAGFFTISTIYVLLAPLSVCRLLQDGITRVDLAVDPSFGFIYFLAKGLYTSFTKDFQAAESPPSLNYNPYENVVEEGNTSLGVRREGLLMHDLDKLTDSLILLRPDKPPRIMSLGEFSVRFGDLSGPFSIALRLFQNFHPRSHPVLWRLLILQAYIDKAIINIYEIKESEVPRDFKPLKLGSLEGREYFDWRQPTDEVPEEEVLEYPFEAVRNLIRWDMDLEKLSDVSELTD